MDEDLLDRPASGIDGRGPLGRSCDALRRAGFRICCLEDTLSAVNVTRSAALHGRLRDVLDEIVAAHAGYRWEVAGTLVNIYPEHSVLDEPVSPVHVEGKGLWRVLEEDIRLGEHGITLFIELVQGDGPPIALSTGDVDLRGVLNAAVGQIPGAYWHMSGTISAFFLTIGVVDTT